MSYKVYYSNQENRVMGQGTSSSSLRSRAKTTQSCKLDGKKSVKTRFAEDVRKLTHAASKWKLGFGKKKNGSKLVRSFSCDAALCSRASFEGAFSETKEERKLETVAEVSPSPEHRTLSYSPSLGDTLVCLGQFVHYSSSGVAHRPTVSDVVNWTRHVDRALHLNGWTTSSFLLESHIVFTFKLMQSAFELFTFSSLTDVKEMFYLCMYVSYTYNANEISYPLRPFLVTGDRTAFWDKCIQLSLSVSDVMLRLNQDREFYNSALSLLMSQI